RRRRLPLRGDGRTPRRGHARELSRHLNSQNPDHYPTQSKRVTNQNQKTYPTVHHGSYPADIIFRTVATTAVALHNVCAAGISLPHPDTQITCLRLNRIRNPTQFVKAGSALSRPRWVSQSSSAPAYSRITTRRCPMPASKNRSRNSTARSSK